MLALLALVVVMFSLEPRPRPHASDLAPEAVNGADAYAEAGRLAARGRRDEALAVLRRELNGLVAAWFHRTGQPHGATHAALRKDCGGPAAAIANADQLRARIDRVREWAARRTS